MTEEKEVEEHMMRTSLPKPMWGQHVSLGGVHTSSAYGGDFWHILEFYFDLVF